MLPRETVTALIEVKEHLEAVENYLNVIRHKMRYARPDEQPMPVKRRLGDALALIDSILAKGR